MLRAERALEAIAIACTYVHELTPHACAWCGVWHVACAGCVAPQTFADYNSFRGIAYAPAVNQVLAQHEASLRNVFTVAAGGGSSGAGSKLLGLHEWRRLLKGLGLIGRDVTERDATLCFCCSRMAVIVSLRRATLLSWPAHSGMRVTHTLTIGHNHAGVHTAIHTSVVLPCLAPTLACTRGGRTQDGRTPRGRMKESNLPYEGFMEALCRLSMLKALPTDVELGWTGCADAGIFMQRLRVRNEARIHIACVA